MNAEVNTFACIESHRGMHVTHFRQRRVPIQIFKLDGLKSWYPPRSIIAGHIKLCQLIEDFKIVKIFLFRKFIPESNAIIVNTKYNDEFSFQILFFLEGYFQLIIMIADVMLFAPGLLPGLIKGSLFRTCDFKSLFQILALIDIEAQKRRIQKHYFIIKH